MSGNQAPKGGTVGINKEFYKGGQFLPSYETTQKGSIKAEEKKQKQIKDYMSKKQLVAPYKYELPPSPELTSIYDDIICEVYFVEKTGYSKETGTTGTLAIIPWKLEDYISEWSDEQKTKLNTLVEKWNSGERWYHNDKR